MKLTEYIKQKQEKKDENRFDPFRSFKLENDKVQLNDGRIIPLKEFEKMFPDGHSLKWDDLGKPHFIFKGRCYHEETITITTEHIDGTLEKVEEKCVMCDLPINFGKEVKK